MKLKKQAEDGKFTMKNMTTKAAVKYVETLHQRSNDARHMSICVKVNEAKHALIRERDELESKCNAYDTYVSLCCERGGSYDAFYSFSDSLYDSMRNEMLKHVDDDEEYEAVYDSIHELSDCDVVAMYIELFEVDEAEVFKKLDSACDELRDAVINEIEYMTDYDESETFHELRNALAEDEKETYKCTTTFVQPSCALDPGERCDCRENNAEQPTHKLVTYADWKAAGSFEKAANPGDYVEACIIDQMRDCLPPACMNFGFLQMGEPYSHELDPDTGKWKPTFVTFKKDGQHWTYCGNCFYKQDTPPKSDKKQSARNAQRREEHEIL